MRTIATCRREVAALGLVMANGVPSERRITFGAGVQTFVICSTHMRHESSPTGLAHMVRKLLKFIGEWVVKQGPRAVTILTAARSESE
jgi:hypothetical protein